VKYEQKIPPVHPGEILQEEFFKRWTSARNGSAKSYGVSPRRINEIIHGKRAIRPTLH